MRLIACAGLATLFLSLSLAPLAHAEKLERPRPTITTVTEGHDLHVIVHDVTDYCSTDADTQILRTKESIRILHERPHHASRCIERQELTFVVKDVDPGRYTVSYERMPLVAPARPLTVASTTAFVH